MTFSEVIELNRLELNRLWAERSDDLDEALENLADTVCRIRTTLAMPIPNCRPLEIYIGSGSELASYSDLAVRAYRALESVKQRSKFIEDLATAVTQ
jgi:hypothetical protein